MEPNHAQRLNAGKHMKFAVMKIKESQDHLSSALRIVKGTSMEDEVLALIEETTSTLCKMVALKNKAMEDASDGKV